jgi:hypothetical protein
VSAATWRTTLGEAARKFKGIFKMLWFKSEMSPSDHESGASLTGDRLLESDWILRNLT